MSRDCWTCKWAEKPKDPDDRYAKCACPTIPKAVTHNPSWRNEKFLMKLYMVGAPYHDCPTHESAEVSP